MTTFHSCADCVVEGMNTQHCPRCHQDFRSTYVGDYHDAGSYAEGAKAGPRRCRTPEEMRAKGFVQDTHGRWKGAPMTGIAPWHAESQPLSAVSGTLLPPEGAEGLEGRTEPLGVERWAQRRRIPMWEAQATGLTDPSGGGRTEVWHGYPVNDGMAEFDTPTGSRRD